MEEHFGLETYQISVPSLPPAVVINDPKNLDYVFKHPATFGKGEFLKARTMDLFGHGIINADGDLWKMQRKAGLQFLNASNVKALSDVPLSRELDKAVKELKKRGPEVPVDLESLILNVTTTVMGRMAYDMDMKTTDPFSQAFEYASDKTGLRFQNPLWRVTEFITAPKLKQSLKTLNRLGNEIVASAVQRREAGRKAAKDEEHTGIEGTLINSLLDLLPTRQIVADSALNYLTGGRDTVAQGLTWCFYTLLHHPEVNARIIEEICAAGPEVIDRIEGDPWTPDYESVSPAQLPYTLAVFYEALRCYPPVPFEIKQAFQDATLPDGTFIPKMSVIVFCIWSMNHSKNIWGPDALEFKPERWLDSNGQIITKGSGEFPVFNGGPRLCLGKRMAEQTGIVVLSKLVWMFEFEDVEKRERISRNSLTLPMDGGLPVYVKPRTQKA